MPATRWSTEAEADPLPPKARARVGHVTLAFLSAGEGPGPLVLWLHGFPRNAYVWRRCLRRAAAAGIRSLAPDLPGLGETAAPQAFDYDVGATAALLCEWLHSRGEDDVRVVGEGVGATVARALAERDPTLVRAVVACDERAAGLWWGLAGRIARAGSGELVLDALRVRRFVTRLDPLGRASPTAALERELALRPLLSSPEARARAAAFLAAARPRRRPAAGVPLLVCGVDGSPRRGGRDRTRPLPAPAVRLATEDPDALLAALLPFLRDPS